MKGNLRRFIGRLESCITPWKIFYGVTVKKKVTEQYFPVVILGSLRYGDYGLRTTAGRALSFVRSTGLSRVNIER